MGNEFAYRRQQLISQLTPNSIVILSAAKSQFQDYSKKYLFCQDSDFYYLTGLNEPALMVILRGDGKDDYQYILFHLPKNNEAEIWTGKRVGQIDYEQNYGADNAYSLVMLDKVMPDLLVNRRSIYFLIGKDTWLDSKVIYWLNKTRRMADKVSYSVERSGIVFPNAFYDLSPLIQEARLLKSKNEIRKIREVTSISAKAHGYLMRYCRVGLRESQLEAKFIHECMQFGCRTTAYPTIVGGGINACTLHYMDNNEILKDGDLVLIDGGGEMDFYAADITRTIPVNGKFTSSQRSIYELVLAAQVAGIAEVIPGNVWSRVQHVILEILVTGLVELGILTGNIDKLIQERKYQPYYMHRSGHWLGLDVHDVGKYHNNGEYRVFEPSMVLTVEPGLYLTGVGLDSKWQGIGIRIEDDILVTEKGYEVLSHEAPKTIEDIEALMLETNL